ncbi:MAG: hypothetical protein AAGA65_20035, partial [Actinomycetota bacterium]
ALFSWYDLNDPARSDKSTTATMVQTGIRFNCNVGVVHAPAAAWESLARRKERKISVWWPDRQTGQLLTILAWMCTRTPSWKRATIEVWVAAGGEDGPGTVAGLLDDARIPAIVRGTAAPENFCKKVSSADLVLAPVRVRQSQSLGPGDVPISELINDLGITVFAHASTAIELDLQPDEGGTAILADAQDRAMELTERAHALSIRAGQLLVEAEILKMHQGNGGNAHRVLARIEQEASDAQRTYIDARARAEEAWRIARELDPTATNEKLDPKLWVGSAVDRLPPTARID